MADELASPSDRADNSDISQDWTRELIGQGQLTKFIIWDLHRVFYILVGPTAKLYCFFCCYCSGKISDEAAGFR